MVQTADYIVHRSLAHIAMLDLFFNHVECQWPAHYKWLSSSLKADRSYVRVCYMLSFNIHLTSSRRKTIPRQELKITEY